MMAKTDEKPADESTCVMVGGWDSFQAIEPHLNAPTPEVVNDAFEEAGVA
jgi:quinol monooxygenase YgiN